MHDALSVVQAPLTVQRGRSRVRWMVWLGLVVLGGCVTPPDRWSEPGDHRGELLHQGRFRELLLHVPAAALEGQPLPLLVALHGGGGSAGSMGRTTGFDALADRGHFLVVYPEGLDGYWNDGREGPPAAEPAAPRPEVDDVGFLRAVVDAVAARLPVDRRRVYATGVSNGGGMCYRLGVEAADVFAAVAPVIASMPAPLHARARAALPAPPLPILVIAGTEDPLVPWEGGELVLGERSAGQVVSIPETVAYWVARNECQVSSVEGQDHEPDDETALRIERWEGGRAPVVLVAVVGGGHTWAGGGWVFEQVFQGSLGRESEELDAAVEVWGFLREHRLGSEKTQAD